jgi:hypothetical protein
MRGVTMRVSRAFPVDLPIDQIDMYRWVTEMTTEDYESFAPAHKAMGSFFRGSRFFMVNVDLPEELTALLEEARSSSSTARVSTSAPALPLANTSMR